MQWPRRSVQSCRLCAPRWVTPPSLRYICIGIVWIASPGDADFVSSRTSASGSRAPPKWRCASEYSEFCRALSHHVVKTAIVFLPPPAASCCFLTRNCLYCSVVFAYEYLRWFVLCTEIAGAAVWRWNRSEGLCDVIFCIKLLSLYCGYIIGSR